MTIIYGILTGFLLGVLSKGSFSININHKEVKEIDQEIQYNESTLSELDPEVKQYYESTNGLNKF
jgi:hypothetical protein